ncbi:hypothetical protein DFH94DRAFT_158648 [Russula ochroleuca]|uniref:Uncharacterized protein n=1 Tax=Russula ochroleuca TaxID=152965 RepID=A0A9P5N3R1_9AGAM|nr:hypothetical protein DFH94DRAFT_158648 [Russula ochroleuca]
MSWLVYPHGSGVEQQQPMSHDYTEASGASRDLAIPSAGPTTLGAIHVMTGDKWTGRLCLDGAYVCAQARAEEATRDPMLSEWPEDLQLELVAVPNISTLDIQAWMLNVKAAVVRLRCPDQMDNRNFDQFVRELREHQGYAIVKWEKQGRALDRLLLVPGGKVLHCAAFLDDNIPEHQESRRIRTLKPRESSQKKKGSRRGPHPGPVATPTSPEGAYYEAAQSNPIADSEEMEDSWIRMRTKTETVTTVTATAGTVCKSPYLCKM